MLRPVRKDLKIIRRSDFDFSLRVYEQRGGDPVDWSSATVMSQMWDRKRETLYGTFTVDSAELDQGLVTFSLDADQTLDLPITGVYDIKVLFPGGLEYFIVTGTFSVSEGYTDD